MFFKTLLRMNIFLFNFHLFIYIFLIFIIFYKFNIINKLIFIFLIMITMFYEFKTLFTRKLLIFSNLDINIYNIFDTLGLI
jgi:hypothetical protein